jgi:hypothetical protein
MLKTPPLKTCVFLPEDQISLNFDTLRVSYKNRELDNVTKLQLVQPLLFGDMILCYHRKIKRLILGRYCRYHNILEPLTNTVMATINNLGSFAISWRYQRLQT